ncbi:hypothetical protein DSM104443_02426 [Usitatibacter rugosus]|uniref:Uncharacterized protein n=1 Tax=Usitatibacter rugosus TaxID=2732067 RepID=A0A6M4GVN8_9PROT|nr:hypothetical protein [Usitatibacter rugosus]QJR11351.1 hypothetical protein DSM104443_02426 [Usitatibacter rugosus]
MRPALLLALVLVVPFPAFAAYDVAAWEEDFTTLGLQAEAFSKCEGRMTEKPRFKGCLQMWDDAKKRVVRMEKFAKATPDPFRTVRMKEQEEKLGTATAFLAPEVRALPKATYSKLMANDKQLATLKPEIEALRKPAPKKPLS